MAVVTKSEEAERVQLEGLLIEVGKFFGVDAQTTKSVINKLVGVWAKNRPVTGLLSASEIDVSRLKRELRTERLHARRYSDLLYAKDRIIHELTEDLREALRLLASTPDGRSPELNRVFEHLAAREWERHQEAQTQVPVDIEAVLAAVDEKSVATYPAQGPANPANHEDCGPWCQFKDGHSSDQV